MTQTLERAVEAVMEERLGRPCLWFPSGRLAVYVALRASLEPGDRILMSPLTDDVVFFTALAAGLRPVMAPVSPDDGNIEPALVPDGVWPALAAVLTTNLYGLPDRVTELRARCDALGIVLIEDAAHALETEVGGRPIGTFGDVAAFSLSKHVGAHGGGFLAFSDEDTRSELERLRDAEIAPMATRDRITRSGARNIESLVVGARLVWPVRWLRRRLGLVERTGHRMPLRPDELRRTVAVGPGLERFDSWVRVDRADYRFPTSRPVLELVLRRLRELDVDRRRRIDGVARLRALPFVAPGARSGEPQPLFRVPLLVEDRSTVVARLERTLRNTGYIYDPPLDDYAGPEFTDPSPTPETARDWARRVVPVDPLEADAVLRIGLG